MTDNVIKTLQTELAQDLVKFEQQADDGTFNEEELKLIVETYQQVYYKLHEINKL